MTSAQLDALKEWVRAEIHADIVRHEYPRSDDMLPPFQEQREAAKAEFDLDRAFNIIRAGAKRP